MSDHTHDPIRDLENFGTGGLPVNPLDPEHVRRLGDKRRSQRRASILIAASALAVVAGIIPVTLAMTNDGGTDAPPLITPSVTPSADPSPTPSQSPTSTPDAGAPRTFDYPGVADLGGIPIYDASDLAQLTGASDEFKTFILGLLNEIKAQTSCGDGRDSSDMVIVSRYSTAGYAQGSTGGCDARSSLWALRDGRWQEVIGSHEIFGCQELDRLEIPRTFVDGCYDNEAPSLRDSLLSQFESEETPSGQGYRTVSTGGSSGGPFGVCARAPLGSLPGAFQIVQRTFEWIPNSKVTANHLVAEFDDAVSAHAAWDTLAEWRNQCESRSIGGGHPKVFDLLQVDAAAGAVARWYMVGWEDSAAGTSNMQATGMALRDNRLVVMLLTQLDSPMDFMANSDGRYAIEDPLTRATRIMGTPY